MFSSTVVITLASMVIARRHFHPPEVSTFEKMAGLFGFGSRVPGSTLFHSPLFRAAAETFFWAAGIRFGKRVSIGRSTWSGFAGPDLQVNATPVVPPEVHGLEYAMKRLTFVQLVSKSMRNLPAAVQDALIKIKEELPPPMLICSAGAASILV